MQTSPHSKYQPPARRRPAFQRSADGRLRPSSGSDDIGNIWAQQRRIQLAEAIEQDKHKAAKKELVKQQGLVGLSKQTISEQYTKLSTKLFGERSKLKPSASRTAPPKKVKLPDRLATQPQPVASKTVEINIALPQSIKLPKPPSLQKVRTLFTTTHTSRSGIAVAFASIVVLAMAGGLAYSQLSNPEQASGPATGSKESPSKPAALSKGTPDFDTVLPTGKTAESLGGWTRISPPETDPVYAYADKISGIPVSVSQQPLPADFKKDTALHIEELAKSFSATDKIDAGKITAYIGTSTKGAQSVILYKGPLLILIKSTAPIPDSEWSKYISSLK